MRILDLIIIIFEVHCADQHRVCDPIEGLKGRNGMLASKRLILATQLDDLGPE